MQSPGNNFLNAAKKGSVDKLSDILDAVSWGKVAPVGTGGLFEIIFSQKVTQLKKSESIYKVLLVCLTANGPNLTAKKIASMFKQPSAPKPKVKSPPAQSCKTAKAKSGINSYINGKITMATDVTHENQAIKRKKLDCGKARQEHTCFGGILEARIGLRMAHLHGQQCCGCKGDQELRCGLRQLLGNRATGQQPEALMRIS